MHQLGHCRDLQQLVPARFLGVQPLDNHSRYLLCYCWARGGGGVFLQYRGGKSEVN
jgi:hypothetical protein